MAPRPPGNGRYKQHGGRVSPACAQQEDVHHPSSSNNNHDYEEMEDVNRKNDKFSKKKHQDNGKSSNET